jgi:L-amino acid N-acyltransferase YncA
VSARPVYAGVAEVSLYVASAFRAKGVGKALLQTLVETSESAGYWTLQAAIFAENHPSLAVFSACGFREVGRRERIARRGGVWFDAVLMERRSRAVGFE